MLMPRLVGGKNNILVPFELAVDPKTIEKRILRRDVTVERRSELDLRDWSDGKYVVKLRLQGAGPHLGEYWMPVENVENDTRVDNPSHSSSPSRSSFIHSSVVRSS